MSFPVNLESRFYQFKSIPFPYWNVPFVSLFNIIAASQNFHPMAMRFLLEYFKNLLIMTKFCSKNYIFLISAEKIDKLPRLSKIATTAEISICTILRKSKSWFLPKKFINWHNCQKLPRLPKLPFVLLYTQNCISWFLPIKLTNCQTVKNCHGCQNCQKSCQMIPFDKS